MLPSRDSLQNFRISRQCHIITLTQNYRFTPLFMVLRYYVGFTITENDGNEGSENKFSSLQHREARIQLKTGSN